jgi:hypothetical protein
LAFFLSEPEFVSELVALVQAEAVVPEELRAHALRAIAVQLYDRNRHASVITAISTGGQAGTLSMLLHRAVASVVASSGGGSETASGATAATSSSGAAEAAPAAAAAAAQPAAAPEPRYSLQFVDALLHLVAALASSASGAQALSDAGLISAVLPLLRHHDPAHIPLVAATVKVLETYMDVAPQGSTMFRDLGGLTEMINRCGGGLTAGGATDVVR